MVSMHVSDENFRFPMKTYLGSDHLPLQTLATVEKNKLALSTESYGWQASLHCWNASRGSQENNT
jgi:hypothetical protein